MIRRTPEAILAAHRMDGTRRELYVEGQRDRVFFNWVAGAEKHPNVTVIEINAVELGEVEEGGERGRLVRFAELVRGRETGIRFVVDADWDRLLGRKLPEGVWVTDGRDLEAYTLRPDCLEKVLSLGLAQEATTANELLRSTMSVARRVGTLRLLSERQALRLPFRRTDLAKFVSIESGGIRLRFDDYLKALMQNGRMSLRSLTRIKREFDGLATELSNLDDGQLVHGKDAFCILERALSRFGVRTGEGSKLIWTSFEKSFIIPGSTLAAVHDFLRSGEARG